MISAMILDLSSNLGVPKKASKFDWKLGNIRKEKNIMISWKHGDHFEFDSISFNFWCLEKEAVA